MAGPIDLAAAVAFVRAKGKPADHAWLKILLQSGLSDEELAALTAEQNPDGGFRVPELGARSVVGRTAEMLLYFAALGAGEFGAPQAAADFLIETQRPDGSWGESDALGLAKPPAHFAPGSIDVLGWETAACVVALSGLGLPLDYRPALEFLRSSRLHLAGQRNFRLETLLLYSAFLRMEGPDGGALKDLRAEAALAHPEELGVFELNWGTFALAVAGASDGDPFVRAFGGALAGRQKQDGGFGSGPASSPFETVLSLGSLEMAGLVTVRRAARAAEGDPDPANSDHGI